MKRNVYLAQVSVMYGQSIFLPYSVGLLQAYAQTIPVIVEAYAFKGFMVRREPIAKVVARLDNPAVLGCSVYQWNEQYSLALAKAVKEAYPTCLVVFGGPQVPERSSTYGYDHPYVDLLVHGEGELTFADVLLETLDAMPQYEKIPGLTILDGQYITTRTPLRERLNDLSRLPSPYLAGIFDDLLDEPYDWQAIVESHRGCPYSCLTLGTKVITMQGEKCIEDIKPYDFVLGWDHDKYESVWNEVHMVLCNGLKQTYHLDIGDYSLVATADHPIFTQRGWVRVEALRVGDCAIMSDMWPSHPKEISTDMLRRMCPREDSSEQTRGSEPDETSRGRCESISSAEGTLFGDQWHTVEISPCGWQDTPPWNISRGTTSHLVTYEAQQSDEKSRSCKTGSSITTCPSQNIRPISRGTTSTFITNDKQQSDEESRSREAVIRLSNAAPQSIRARSDGISPEISSSLQVYRKFQFLGWPGTIREMQESRLRQFGRKEARHTRPWVLLAQGRDGYRGTNGLPSTRLEVPPGMGYPEAQSRAEQDHPKLCLRWEPIRAVTPHDWSTVFDIDTCPTHTFFANGVLVHNCSFCDWGSATQSKVYEFLGSRIAAEFDWCGRHQIRFLYSADANYGILKRDVDLTQALVDVKRHYGFPKEFRACTAKNSGERVFEISRILTEASMSKGATLSLQSVDPHTLEAVHRGNIKMDDFAQWMQRYHEASIATYTEIILGLPGETYETFANGLNTIIDADQHEHINVYQLQLLPNSEMSQPAYIAKHSIKSVRMPVLLQHSTPSPDDITEYHDIVVGTATMPQSDWERSYLFAWAVQTFHCMGLSRLVAMYLHEEHGLSYRHFYEGLVTFAAGQPWTMIGQEYQETRQVMLGALKGEAWDIQIPKYGPIIWPSEESSFLNMVIEKPELMRELFDVVKLLGQVYGLNLDMVATEDLLRYQSFIVRDPYTPKTIHVMVDYDWPAYFQALEHDSSIPLKEGSVLVTLEAPEDYQGDLEAYGRSCVWYGRKSGNFYYTPTFTRALKG